MSSAEIITYDLRHEIQLTIRNDSGQLEVCAIASFLASAMPHFKAQRDKQGKSNVAGASDGELIAHHAMTLGRMQVSCEGNSPMVEVWVDAVVDAYANNELSEEISYKGLVIRFPAGAESTSPKPRKKRSNGKSS